MSKSKFLKALLYPFFLLLGLGGIWTAVNFIGSNVSPGQPAISRAKEITGIEYPVDDNGDIEYLQLINAKQMISIKVDNNAVVPIVRNCDPGILEQYPDSFFFLLGIARPESEGQKFEPATDWIWKNILHQSNSAGVRGGKKTAGPTAEQFVEYATNNPWTDDELPELEQWLEAMTDPINEFEKASKRSKFYMPVVAADADNAPLMHVQQELLKYFLDLGPVFMIQANRCLGNRDYEGWLENVETLYRFGALVSKGNSFANQLYAASLHRTGDTAIASAAKNGKLDPDQLRELFRKLEDMPEIEGMPRSIRKGEKWLAYHLLTRCVRESKSEIIARAEPPGLFHSIIFSAADFNKVLEIMDNDFEQVASIAELPKNQMMQAVVDLEAEMEQRAIKNENPVTGLFALLGGRTAKGEFAGESLSLMKYPSPQVYCGALHRSTIRNLTKLTIALELYKQEKKKYPDRLEDLAPDFIPGIDRDLFTNDPLIYKVTNEDYALYSCGFYGADDDGPTGPNAKTFGDVFLRFGPYQRWHEFLEDQLAN